MKNEDESKATADELIKLRRKVAELEKSEGRYREIVENVKDIIFTLSPEGTITSLNTAFETVTGWQREQYIGKNFQPLVHPDDLPLEVLVYRCIFGEKIHPQGFELRILSKSGGYITMEFTVKPQTHDRRVVGYQGIARDITYHKRTEEVLQQSEEKYRTLIENIQDGVFLIQDGKIEFANEAFARMCGYTVEEVIGKDFRELVAPEDLEMVVNRYFRRQAGEDVLREYEFHGIKKDGTRTTVNINVGLITYRGKVASIGTVKDITERRRAIEQIQEQAALLDKAHDAIIVRDMEHRITYWNQGAQRLYGWTADEAIGKNANELLYKEEPPSLIEARKNVIDRDEWNGELSQITKEGREIIVESRWTLVRDSNGNSKSILIINTDITEKKILEAQFLRAQRLESIGALAGGIAHDLNNVLAPITLSLQSLKEKLTDDESRRLLGILERNAKRGAYLIKQILLSSRGVEGERKNIQVADLISDAENFAKETFPSSIEIRTDVSGDIWNIIGDAVQLQQVLMNLCVNARYAMSDGGILRISAENLFIDESFIRVNAEAKIGPYIIISVSDTGTGIPPEIMNRIFEPFFTTKKPGKGTGLGLSTSLAIVKSHGGFITVHSEAGKGTIFKVYLPAVKAKIRETDVHQPEPVAERKELILVVDNETNTREMARETLEAHGYRVLIASDGAEAVSLYSSHKGEIKAVLIDMMMPVMDGPACIWVLRKINPDVRLIAVSRSAEDDMLANIAGVVHAFLMKPYTVEELLNTVRRVIDK
ncbi:PAS domain-containing hybrid sensor histidine kinase/response regulator [Candidatus Methanoperedens nitratireducens]|uniref:Multi-sensor hybrid histidine kinase n=1 Tax=Candidatus Methanoperedens nitratireducens TaxID=1392998 RepID=A0A284VTG6_9EURY